MKQFFTHPITITVGIILTLGILAIVGYNYWGWFGGKSKHPLGANVPPYPTNPKEGDKFTYKGIQYIYSCIQPECLLPPCPPICDWKISDNVPTHRVVNGEHSSENNSDSTSRSASTIPQNPKMTFRYCFNKTDDKYWILKSSTNPMQDSVWVFDHAEPVVPKFQNYDWKCIYKETNIPYSFAQNIKNIGKHRFEFEVLGTPLLNKNNIKSGKTVTVDYFGNYKHNYITGTISSVQPTNPNAIAIDIILPSYSNQGGATIYFD